MCKFLSRPDSRADSDLLEEAIGSGAHNGDWPPQGAGCLGLFKERGLAGGVGLWAVVILLAGDKAKI